MHTQGCRWRSNPGLKLANAFGVLVQNFKLTQQPKVWTLNFELFVRYGRVTIL